MDPTRYWMLTRRKLGEPKVPLFSSSNITVGSAGSSSTSYHESCEERAFAEDSAEHLGGCIWPPRSYSCSFCGREFRSAQALGGHMNVHRRDRARLKLAGVPDDGASDNQIVSPCQSVVDDHPSISLVQATAAGNVWHNQLLSAPPASLPTWIDSGKRKVFRDAPQTSNNHARPAEKMRSNQELPVGSRGYKLSTLGCCTRRDFREGSEDGHSVHVGCKRGRIDLETSPLIPCSFSRKHQQDEEDNGEEQPNDPKVLKLCPSSQVEELDLELRLGVSPKVK